MPLRRLPDQLFHQGRQAASGLRLFQTCSNAQKIADGRQFLAPISGLFFVTS